MLPYSVENKLESIFFEFVANVVRQYACAQIEPLYRFSNVQEVQIANRLLHAEIA